MVLLHRTGKLLQLLLLTLTLPLILTADSKAQLNADSGVTAAERSSMMIAEIQRIRISGRTVGMPDEMPLGFVNIGISGTNIGTVSNERGEFSLIVARDRIDDILIFSALGYESERRTIRELFQSSSQNIIYLHERAIELEEVGISASRLEEEELGFLDLGFNYISAGFQDKSPGFELAMLMQARRYPSIIQNIRFYVNYNPARSGIIRINVYENDDGVPGRNIVTRNIIFRTTQTEGWVRFNMEPHRVVVQDDFFIGLEWIENLEADDNISMFLAGKRKVEPKIFSRASRHDQWQKSELSVVLSTMVIN